METWNHPAHTHKHTWLWKTSDHKGLYNSFLQVCRQNTYKISKNCSKISNLFSFYKIDKKERDSFFKSSRNRFVSSQLNNLKLNRQLMIWWINWSYFRYFFIRSQIVYLRILSLKVHVTRKAVCISSLRNNNNKNNNNNN